jgi:hypothetical protein
MWWEGSAKRRTREHIIADLSVNHVEQLVLRCGWTVERSRHGYGVDRYLQTYNADGAVEAVWVRFQLKATGSLRRSAECKTIPFRLEWRDLLFWLNEAEPVILVVYDAQEDRAYWLYVQAYFRQMQWAARATVAATVTVHIPAGNVLDEAAIRLFAQFRDAVRSDGKENPS